MPTYRRVVALLLVMVALAGALAVLSPISAGMPTPGLDPSWMLAMNVSVARGLQIGRDIVFTMGPYSAIYTRQYHPGTDAMAVAGGVFLSFGYAYLVWLLGRRDLVLMAMMALGIPFNARVPDAAFASYALYAAVGSFLLARQRVLRAPLAGLHLLVVSGFGLLFAVKASFLWLAVLCAGLSAVAFAQRRRPVLAAGVLLAPVAMLVIAWVIAGQPVAGILPYVTSSFPMTSGYTEAMALPGPRGELVAYAAAALLVLAGALRARQVLLLAVLGGFLFVEWKAGFVRHDGHALVAGMAAILAAFALRAATARRTWLGIVAAVAAFLVVNADLGVGWQDLAQQLYQPYRSMVGGIQMRLAGTAPAQFDGAMAAIRTSNPVPSLPGTTDLYTIGISALLASDDHWNPRPVLQGYSAYTPELQRMDMDHLRGAHAPDHILFSPDTIDATFPALTDGPSWPVILKDYQPQGMRDGFVVFDRKPGATGVLRDATATTTEHVQLGAQVAVPATGGLLIATIRTHRSLLSKLAALLFKPARLFITLTLADGSTRYFRFIGEEAEQGFVLSPLVETPFDLLAASIPDDRPPAKQVVRFALSQQGRWGAADKTFDVTLSTVALPPLTTVAPLFEPVLPALPGPLPQPTACRGFIDALNGRDPGLPIAASSVLDVAGWLAVDVPAGILPDKVWVTITPKDGHTGFFAAHAEIRPDVAETFGQPLLRQAGYLATTYIAAIHGPHTIGLAYSLVDRNYVCTNLERTAVLP